ncbi:Glycerol-3-phosphate dehydrogenase [NAD(P)+] [Klebsiella pneumoniae ISC21]|nr:Glycerol-3-phosphate dehydrogenase [NAD(P)+] [Klebsiella pneumoniae ISC21]
MNALNAAMTVIGAGSYGTALAITLARNGHHVVLWGHDPKHIATLQHDRCNAAFLPDVPFPDTLHLESDLATALAASRDILVVVPSHVFGQVLRQIKPLMRSDARLVWATKGLEAETGRLLQDVAREALGDDIPLAVISGPTFAKELAAGLPTAISLAATDPQFCGRPSAPTALRQKLPRLHQPGLYRRAARRRGEKRHCHRGRYVGWHRLRRQCAYGADYPWAGGNVPPRRGAGRRSGNLYGQWPAR